MADERAVDRIVDLETTTSPLATDYVPVDSTNQGTRRLSFPNLADKALDELNTKDFNISTVGNRTIPNHIRVLNDRIGNIIAPSGQASLSELVDARVNFLGEVFPTVGDAIRVTDEFVADLENASVKVTTGMCLNSSFPYPATYDTYSVKLDRYIGGRIILLFNYHGGTVGDISGNSIVSNLALYGMVSDTATPNAQDGTHIGTTLYNFWKEHAYGRGLYVYGTDSAFCRTMYSLPIPENIGYDYLWLSVINNDYPQTVVYVTDTLVSPLFAAYGRKGGTLTFTDTSQDGNIVIS